MTVAEAHGAELIGTCLFTDLVGFTEYTDVVGDAAAVEVLDHQTALAERAVSNCGDARIVKELGDGLLLWFGAAPGALTAAAAPMTTIVRARDEGIFPLSVRMGMHHGPARVRGADLVGQTINITARIADLAGPGELLVSEHAINASSLAPWSQELHPIGPVMVKGVRDPIWLHRLQV